MTSSVVARALHFGLSRAAAAWGMVALLLLVNLTSAALLAVPLAGELARDFGHSMTSVRMLYGFDYSWWSQWAETNARWSFGPDVFGTGFAFKNLDLLLRGRLPAGAFAVDTRADGGAAALGLPPLILGLGVAYLLLQVFLSGGVLGVLRAPQPSWTMRGLLHGAGFYFGRLFRLALLVFVLHAAVFTLYAPFAHWVDDRAREAVSGRTALLWYFGRSALVFLAILVVHMVASYARVIVVLEERASALLALLSSAAFCARHFLRAFGHLVLFLLLGVAVLAVFGALDGRWHTTGYKTQIVTFAFLEAFVFARLFLRVALLGGQVELYRSLTGPGGPVRS